MNKKVAIVGYSPTLEQAPFDDETWDIWGLNTHPERFKRFTKWFDVHGEGSLIQYKNFAVQNQEKLILAEIPDWLPKAELYPKTQIMKKYGDFFTNSVSWMIALAIEKGYKEIGIYGIDLSTKKEYQEQRPSVLYFIGLAKGLGIEITLPNYCQLFDKERLYWL